MGDITEDQLRSILRWLEDGVAAFAQIATAARELLLSKAGPYNEADCAKLTAALAAGSEVIGKANAAL